MDNEGRMVREGKDREWKKRLEGTGRSGGNRKVLGDRFGIVSEKCKNTVRCCGSFQPFSLRVISPTTSDHLLDFLGPRQGDFDHPGSS